MTLEEAQEQLLEAQERITELETERDSLSQKNNELSEHLERVRTQNQRYFEKLSAQVLPTEKHEEPDEPSPSCEEFAKTINL